MPDEQVRIDIVADDHASKPIDAIAKKVDQLDDPVRIPIDADTKEAERDVAGLLKKVDGLARDPASILLATNAAKIAGDIADLIGDLDRLDANDPTVEVKVDQLNALAGDLDKVEGKLRDINSTPVDIDTKPAKQGIDDVGKSLDGAKSVSANAIGNMSQDLSALGGIAGSSGVAIGQMGEYFADAAAAGDESIGKIAKNFLTVAGPLTAATIAVSFLTDAFVKMQAAAAETKAFRRERVDAFVDALRDATVTAEELKDVLSTGGKGPGIFVRVADETRNADEAVEHLFGSLENFNAQVAKGIAGYDAWAAGLLAAQVAGGATEEQLAKLKIVLDDARDGSVNATAAVVAQSDGLGVVQEAAIAYASTIEDAAGATNRAAFESRFYAKEVDKAADNTAKMEQAAGRTALGIAAMGREWDILTGKLDAEQAIINLGLAFDDLKAKGEDAFIKTAEGADDAKAAQDDYKLSIIAAKDQVITLGRQIGLSVPEVKSMLLQIDDGDIPEVERKLAILTRNRTMELSIIARGGNAFSSGYAGVGPTSMMAPAEVVNVTQHLPRGYRGDALGDARKAARRSGGLYRRSRR